MTRRAIPKDVTMLRLVASVAVILVRCGIGNAEGASGGVDWLDEKSVVLITGAAGFIGSELAIALHRTYNVKKLLCIDSLESGFGQTSSGDGDADGSGDGDEGLRSRTQEELALFEFKRQRAFRVLQTVGSKAHFYRADFRPSIPEYFDMGEVPLLDTILKTHPDVTHIVHLADPYHGAMFDKGNLGLLQAIPRVKEQTKAGMMEALLEQLKKFGDEHGADKVPHFTFASSFEVYNHFLEPSDNPNPPPFREEGTITTPSSLRGAAKLIDEILANTYSRLYGISSIGLRFFPIYGPWGLPGTALFEMAERAISDDVSSILATGVAAGGEQPDDLRDYVYIDDAVDAIMAAMQFPVRDHSLGSLVINVGTGEANSLRQVAKEMASQLNEDSLDEQNFEVSDSGDTTESFASVSRAESLLGFKARVSLAEGITNLLAWHHDRAYPYGRPLPADATNLSTGSKDGVTTKKGTETIATQGMESCSPFDKDCLRGAPVFPCASECSNRRQCIPSFYDDAVLVTREITATCKEVMYTVALQDDLSVIPSAKMSVTTDSVPSIRTPQPNEGVSINSCNIAFVAEGSFLVQRMKRERGIASRTVIVDEYLDAGKDVDRKRNLLLKHGFWTLIPVSIPSLPSSEAQILEMLPKLSPGLFFSQSIQYAVYCEPTILFNNVEELLSSARMQPKKKHPSSDGTTVMMVPDGTHRRDVLEYSFANKDRRGLGSGHGSDFEGGAFDTTAQREALQERAYNMIRVGLRGEMPGGGAAPIADSSWIVHRLGGGAMEDARLFRCDIYGEVVQWNVAHDKRAMEYIMGLHDLWSRVMVLWRDGTPWWKNTASAEAADEWGGEVGAGGSVVGNRFDDGMWMGVLSSTEEQFFVRIVPPGSAGVFYLDDV